MVKISAPDSTQNPIYMIYEMQSIHMWAQLALYFDIIGTKEVFTERCHHFTSYSGVTHWLVSYWIFLYYLCLNYHHIHHNFHQEKTGQCKPHMLPELKASPYLLWWIQDLDRVCVKRIWEHWVDVWTDPWASAGHIIYSWWKMLSEYFIDSLSCVISHSRDRLQDLTFNISCIAMGV